MRNLSRFFVVYKYRIVLAASLLVSRALTLLDYDMEHIEEL